ncbi:TIGR04086 family membrane protein [Oceanobacillus jeddahense]|uniref:TIGR04086 family membrane protein n=1 Tax=Oceanobacillus jeddahense TaxID=1462527 RepID=A0ABY5JY75_9BACI|nr:TIGR04086 family membrane protein [Oceanobacillus jeddahense]UUI05353.1 TIGR04086 family membrane protein [Oceanobacillus jeddahense]
MEKIQWTSLFYGWIILFALLFITSFTLGLVLKFLEMKEATLSWTTFIIGLLILFSCGMVTGLKGKAKGWLLGLLIGLGFTGFVFLVQFLGYQQAFSLSQAMYHGFYLIAAILGGIIGVNFSSPAEE